MATIFMGGPQGPQGAQGAQGAPGAGDGSSGAQGSQGETGFQGSQGAAGSQGFQGLTGSQGAAGSQGFQGLTGSQGEAGSQGAAGSQGFQGLAGSQGSQGEAGSQGATGSQGTTGSQGFQGSVGVGTQGAQGAQGSQGGAGEVFSGTYSSTYILSRITTGSVAGDDAELTTDGLAPSGSNKIILSNNSTSMFDIMITGRRTDVDGEGAAYKISVVLERNSNAASTSIIGGDYKVIVAEDNSAWDANVDADTTYGGLKIYISSQAGKTVKWTAFVRELKSVE